MWTKKHCSFTLYIFSQAPIDCQALFALPSLLLSPDRFIFKGRTEWRIDMRVEGFEVNLRGKEYTCENIE